MITKSSFKVEKAPNTPLDAYRFPNLIRAIEMFLDCKDVWNFRVAFENVCVEETTSLKALMRKQTKEADLQPKVSDRQVSMRSCICTTKLFRSPSLLRAHAADARLLFCL